MARAAGSQAPLAWLFALSSLLVVSAQLPVTRWAGNRLDLRRSMAIGLSSSSAARQPATCSTWPPACRALARPRHDPGAGHHAAASGRRQSSIDGRTG
ncbi:hypothetical protein ALI22I_17370 [Saccharothrix sp. ALI-22-I]|nr:hypothetical protein ALI22I_17370 [Saccharothrix sp. ALI-22-I]